MRDRADDALNFLRAGAAAGRDDLAADILSDGGGTIERQEDGSLQLSLSALDLCFADGVGQARPFAEGEVDKIVDLCDVLGDEVDTP